jgi:hypothetical protein
VACYNQCARDRIVDYDYDYEHEHDDEHEHEHEHEDAVHPILSRSKVLTRTREVAEEKINTPPSPSPPRRTSVVVVFNIALIAVSLVVVAIPAEFVFRHRYGHMMYNPRPEVRAVQQYLTLDSTIGFKWQPNISPELGVRFAINDMTTPPLTTDGFGAINSSDAIAERLNGRAVDVVGLGDSFMEMAAGAFHERFREAGLSYYSLAIHRQCPPQYNAILESWAAELKPKAIVYGIFENDFAETTDFASWRESGVDWFTYHSGAWCGPPIGVGAVERFTRTHARGWYVFGRVLNAKIRGENMSVLGPSAAEVDAVAGCVRDAAERAQAAHARFILVVIPSKQTATGGDTGESRAYDAMLESIRGLSIDRIDLRDTFRAHPDPASLYYVKDGHWNDKGIALAAAAILKQFESGPNEPRNH